VGLGSGNRLSIVKEIHFPHSLGLLYSALTYYTGFKVNSGEYKVMGLAPYGEPRYVAAMLEHLVDLREDGSFRLNLEYFNYCVGLTMTNARFHRLFGGPPRKPGEPLTARHMDLAASVQAVLEEAVLRMTERYCATASSRTCGYSPRPATPEERWARRWLPTIFWKATRVRWARRTPCTGPTWGRSSLRRRSKTDLDGWGRGSG
jgi:predicted NodU family carbamoyl transferase